MGTFRNGGNIGAMVDENYDRLMCNINTMTPDMI